MEVDAQGGLAVSTSGGMLLNSPKPAVYQERNGKRQVLEGRYVIHSGGTQRQWVGVEVAGYDRTRPLVIDPQVIYGSYFGGSGGTDFIADADSGVAVDPSGNIYITGYTASANFPHTAGAFQGKLKGGFNCFVAKFAPNAASLIYSTFLGGSYSDSCASIAADAKGNAYITGNSLSKDYPTKNPFQPKSKGFQNAVVTKLNPSGSALLYSTYLGGSSGSDLGSGIAVDSKGSAYVTGSTASHDFPHTAGAFQTALKGSSNAFITKFTADGAHLAHSTFLGGSGPDSATSIALDSIGDAFVAGNTPSANFPVHNAFKSTNPNPAGAAFATQLNSGGTGLVYSTYLGGTDGVGDIAFGIAVDPSDRAIVAGSTGADNFPVTPNAAQKTFKGGVGFTASGFVTRFSPSGNTLDYSTYLGGSGNDFLAAVSVDAQGNFAVAGGGTSLDIPQINPIPGQTGGYGLFLSKDLGASVSRVPGLKSSVVTDLAVEPITAPTPAAPGAASHARTDTDAPNTSEY